MTTLKRLYFLIILFRNGEPFEKIWFVSNFIFVVPCNATLAEVNQFRYLPVGILQIVANIVVFSPIHSSKD
jgi:hypothetical protein